VIFQTPFQKASSGATKKLVPGLPSQIHRNYHTASDIDGPSNQESSLSTASSEARKQKLPGCKTADVGALSICGEIVQCSGTHNVE
jgi:hypothetical protein